MGSSPLWGAFAFDASAMSSKHKRLTVTPAGIKFLTKLGIVPEISHERIEDPRNIVVVYHYNLLCLEYTNRCFKLKSY